MVTPLAGLKCRVARELRDVRWQEPSQIFVFVLTCVQVYLEVRKFGNVSGFNGRVESGSPVPRVRVWDVVIEVRWLVPVVLGVTPRGDGDTKAPTVFRPFRSTVGSALRGQLVGRVQRQVGRADSPKRQTCGLDCKVLCRAPGWTSEESISIRATPPPITPEPRSSSARQSISPAPHPAAESQPRKKRNKSSVLPARQASPRDSRPRQPKPPTDARGSIATHYSCVAAPSTEPVTISSKRTSRKCVTATSTFAAVARGTIPPSTTTAATAMVGTRLLSDARSPLTATAPVCSGAATLTTVTSVTSICGRPVMSTSLTPVKSSELLLRALTLSPYVPPLKDSSSNYGVIRGKHAEDYRPKEEKTQAAKRCTFRCRSRPSSTTFDRGYDLRSSQGIQGRGGKASTTAAAREDPQPSVHPKGRTRMLSLRSIPCWQQDSGVTVEAIVEKPHSEEHDVVPVLGEECGGRIRWQPDTLPVHDAYAADCDRRKENRRQNSRQNSTTMDPADFVAGGQATACILYVQAIDSHTSAAPPSTIHSTYLSIWAGRRGTWVYADLGRLTKHLKLNHSGTAKNFLYSVCGFTYPHSQNCSAVKAMKTHWAGEHREYEQAPRARQLRRSLRAGDDAASGLTGPEKAEKQFSESPPHRLGGSETAHPPTGKSPPTPPGASQRKEASTISQARPPEKEPRPRSRILQARPNPPPLTSPKRLSRPPAGTGGHRHSRAASLPPPQRSRITRPPARRSTKEITYAAATREVFNEYIADPLSDYSLRSEDFDIQVEDSLSPRRISTAVPLQYSSDSDDSSNSEMSTE
ncbi:hypothetical protein WN48_07822 [Eufriesea mexicana]|uniref:Uncharacterized protein n=1 Tax=Eufriesea mexicana TaxID=516756 RepID=A0A310SLM3_9HYME|nr:hypothetical protein WN48_07822 [Eufriesea mexicana]